MHQRGSRLVVHDPRLIDEAEATYDRLSALADQNRRHSTAPVAAGADDPVGWKETIDDPVHSR